MAVNIKRIYDPSSPSDGYRVLVDRLWPRGLSKDKAKIDLWLKEVAPTSELRKWFNHDTAKFDEFSARYESELKDNRALAELKKLTSQHKTVTLLYGAKDPNINHAAVLKSYLKER